VRIRIADRHTGGWGHVNVDQIVQSDDESRPEDDRDAAIARAMQSVRDAEPLAAKDPARPAYHFLPPANWMNDPNGPIYYKGYYHLFYQHNPYGDRWGNMHWGHARSKDLVKWEHLPIALWPSKVKGEEHVFSGCAWVDHRGKPLLFYTSIGHPVPECWVAEPEDNDLIKWKKHPANPVLTQNSFFKNDPSKKLYEFRDPCIFEAGKQTYMVHGGNLNDSKGGQAVVTLYHATNEALTAWEPAGILFKHPDPAVKNIECPLFFPIGDKGGKKWVLVTSPYRSPDWFVGDLDAATGTFTPTADGILDRGNFYAPNSLEDGKNRRIMWGWVNGFPEGKGWNGCLTLPRVITMGPDGRLRQNPAKELEKLRGQQLRVENADLTPPKERVVEQVVGESFEIAATFDLRDASSVAIRLRRSKDGRRASEIRWDGKVLDVAGTKTTLRTEARTEPLTLRGFLDHSLLEVYADEGRECVTKVLPYHEGDVGVSLVGDDTGTVRVVDFRYWPLKSIWSTAR
jgi:beta-fructofuranosidase